MSHETLRVGDIVLFHEANGHPPPGYKAPVWCTPVPAIVIECEHSVTLHVLTPVLSRQFIARHVRFGDLDTVRVTSDADGGYEVLGCWTRLGDAPAARAGAKTGLFRPGEYVAESGKFQAVQISREPVAPTVKD